MTNKINFQTNVFIKDAVLNKLENFQIAQYNLFMNKVKYFIKYKN